MLIIILSLLFALDTLVLIRFLVLVAILGTLMRCIQKNNFKFVKINSSEFEDLPICVTVLTTNIEMRGLLFFCKRPP